jgi:hypothetical protein
MNGIQKIVLTAIVATTLVYVPISARGQVKVSPGLPPGLVPVVPFVPLPINQDKGLPSVSCSKRYFFVIRLRLPALVMQCVGPEYE